MKAYKIFSLSCLLLSLLAACSTATAPHALLTPMVEDLPVTSVWQKHIGAPGKITYSKLTPAIDNQTLFVVDTQGNVIAVNINDGATQWAVNIGKSISGGVVVGDATLFIPTSDGKLYALNEKNGAELWHVDLPNQSNTAPTYSHGQVYVKTIDDVLVALNAATGKQKWQYDAGATQLQLMGSSRAVTLDNRVYAGFSDGKLNAVNASTGELEWQSIVSMPQSFSDVGRLVGIFADPVISGGVIYAVGYHGTLSALELSSGRLLWQRPMSVYSGIAVNKDAVYVSDSEGVVWALSRRSGSVLWKQDTLEGLHLTAPVLMDNNIIVADDEGNVHWLSQQDGHFIARTQFTKSSITIAPQLSNDLLIIKANNGDIIVYKEKA